MYKVIFAFLCGFFTYGIATHVVPARTMPARAALAAPDQLAGHPAIQPLLRVDDRAGARRTPPVYLPLPGAASCADAGQVCAWSI